MIYNVVLKFIFTSIFETSIGAKIEIITGKYLAVN